MFISFLEKLLTQEKKPPTKQKKPAGYIKSAETNALFCSATLVYTSVMHINKSNKQWQEKNKTVKTIKKE